MKIIVNGVSMSLNNNIKEVIVNGVSMSLNNNIKEIIINDNKVIVNEKSIRREDLMERSRGVFRFSEAAIKKSQKFGYDFRIIDEDSE